MSDLYLHVGKAYKLTSSDGSRFDVWSITSSKPFCGDTGRPVIIHLHGGAFIKGGLTGGFDATRFRLKQLPPDFLHRTNFCLLSVQYRLALKHPFPAALEDAYATILWAQLHAAKLKIDISRMFVLGVSAGGGLGISLIAKARDEKISPPLRGLMAIYPMVDPNSQRKWATWITQYNAWSEMALINRGWNAYLRGSEQKGSQELKYAIPLSQSLHGFPPTYLDVGTDDLFFKEVEQLATKFRQTNINCQIQEWKKMVHNFEALNSEDIQKTIRAAQNTRMAWLEVQIGY
jgi:acetyl esterase/lipase